LTAEKRIVQLFRTIDRMTRRREWEPKLADLALFTGFALALRARGPSSLFIAGCLFLAAAAALAVFGYAWNGLCDASADSLAGKNRPTRGQSRVIALTAASLTAAFFAAAAGLDLVLLALGFAALALTWAYSGRPLRLKERGALGLLAGAVAQRTLPAVFVVVAFNVPPRFAAPWLLWMVCCGLRGMVTHQIQDAGNDRKAGLATWGTRPDAERTSERLVAVLVPVELSSLALAIMPLLGHGITLVAALASLAVWTIQTARSFARARAGGSEWLSFRSVPLADLYGVIAPFVVAVALLRLHSSIAPAWIAVDATVRRTMLKNTWRRLVHLRARLAAPRYGNDGDRLWRIGEQTRR
jgi:4-hydroxybenzoate polyprenyltransferase